MPLPAADFISACRSGVLNEGHVFYQLVAAGAALFSGAESAVGPHFWRQHPALLYLAEEAHRAGPNAYRMFRGMAFAGGSAVRSVPDPTRLLFPLPSSDVIKRVSLPVRVQSGPDKSAIRRALTLCTGLPALKTDDVVLHLAFLCTDGKSITAAIQPHMGQVIGTLNNLSSTEMSRILDLQPAEQSAALSALAARCSSSVQEFMLTASAAGTGALRVGYYAISCSPFSRA